MQELDTINSALSFGIDLKSARPLVANSKSDACFQGQTHGHEGFLLSSNEAQLLITKDQKFATVVHPFIITDDLIGTHTGKPSRYVIDFGKRDVHQAQSYKDLFARVEKRVLPDRKTAAEKERLQNEEAKRDNAKGKIAKDHANALDKWWLLFRARGDMISSITSLPRYIVCGRVTRRPIFAFLHSAVHPNDSLAVFPLADDYSFGILQSGLHWLWFTQRCSTMKADWRYTSNTVFDSFPWPQSPNLAAIEAVAAASVALRKLRSQLLSKNEYTLRGLYKTLDKPGSNSMKDAQLKLDDAVRQAYGMAKTADPVSFLLELNLKLAALESAGKIVIGPGLPSVVTESDKFITSDCIRA